MGDLVRRGDVGDPGNVWEPSTHVVRCVCAQVACNLRRRPVRDPARCRLGVDVWACKFKFKSCLYSEEAS